MNALFSAPRSDADRADEALIERLRHALEPLADAHLEQPALRRRCFLAARARPEDFARLGEAAHAAERIRCAALARAPHLEIGGTA